MSSKDCKRQSNSSPAKAVETMIQPLPEPRRQIRLLKCRTPSESGKLSLDSSVWDIEEAPEYVAISYTWGTTDVETILINNVATKVRSNCRYALWQTQLHFPGRDIWIDSVCINQDDDAEKSAQVAMMFRIYQQAWRAVSCLGKHGDDSRWLAAMLDVLGLIEGSSGPLLLSTPKIYVRILELLGSSEHERFLWAIRALDEHPYWRRLWIVQELAAGEVDVVILLGESKLDTSLLYDLTIELFLEGHHVHDALSFCVRPERRFDLGDVFLRANKLLCVDLRDKLYGMLSLVNWQEVPGGIILPDYSKSIWDIARLVAPRVALSDIPWMLRAFQIDADHENMKCVTSKLRTQQVVQTSEGHAIEKYLETFHQNDVTCANIVATDDLALHITLERLLDGDCSCGDCSMGVEICQMWHTGKADGSPIQHAHPVFIDGQLAALLCPEARPGDIIFRIELKTLLVARQGLTLQYGIVGQGILLNHHAIPTRSDERSDVCKCVLGVNPRNEPFIANISLRLTADELLALIGQDVRYMPDDLWDCCWPEPRLLRLLTRPSLMPDSAVTLEPVHYRGCEEYFADK